VGNVSKFGCSVSWEPPESDGGSPVTSYVIELRDRTSVKWTPVQVTKADELTAVINDVIENKEYIFRVRAENKAGEGKPSAASLPVKIMDPIGESGSSSRLFVVPRTWTARSDAGLFGVCVRPLQSDPVPLRTWSTRTRTRAPCS